MSGLKIHKGFRLVIIGSGPTAFGVLHYIYSMVSEGTLKEEDVQIVILEREDEVGGLSRSITDEKGFTWDLGVHVLGVSKHREFEEFINKVVRKWNKVKRCVKVDLSHLLKSDSIYSNYVPYPVQQSIPYFPQDIRQKCVDEMKKLQSGRIDNYSNFAEYSANVFGETLLDIFIRPYNRKIISWLMVTVFVSVWTVELEEMSASWVSGRIPRIDLHKIESYCGRSRQELEEEDRNSSSLCFKYPKDYKGVGEIWKKVARLYPKSIFRLQENVYKVDVQAKKVYTEDWNHEIHSYDYDAILSTIPLPELGNISAVTGSVNLKWSKVILVGLGLKFPQCEWTQIVTWAYFPSPDTIFYRCTFPSNFSDNLTPDCDRFWSILCEIGLEANANFIENELILKAVEGLKLKGIITENSEIIDEWLCVLPYGYPIPTIGRDDELRRCHEAFQAHNIYSRGRFGGWKYELSNQDHCFMIGMQFADFIFYGNRETLYVF